MSAKLLTVPVVIVGKDRTRMTCAVIDHIKKHIRNAKPYFICVSDRSRAGHDVVVENHLKEIGETKYEVLRTLPEENRYGWGCAINIGLDCAFDVCKDSDFALVVDNDWLLQRDLDIDKYGYAFAFSNIGAITFKSVNAGTNVALTEKTLADGSTYLFRTAHATLSRFSFTAEIGCMLITRQMRREYSQFKENCKTDETEWAFCNWYNSLTCEDKNDKHLWFANDRDMYHTELNGEGHVFTHVGLHSQHEGPHKWQVPEQYLYLSDDEADSKLCHDAYWIPSVPEASLIDDNGFWQRNKVLFATNFADDEDNPLRVSYDILKNIAREGEVYVASPPKFGRDAFFDIFSYALENGYEYVIYSDADNFIVSEANLRAEFSDFLKDKNLMFSGPTDGGTIFHRNGSAYAINPFLLFVRLGRIRKYYDKDEKTFTFPAKETLSADKVSGKTRDSSNDAIVSWRNYRKEHGINLSIAEEIAHGTDNPYVKFWFGRQWIPYSVNESRIDKEPYYDIFIGACKDGGSNQYMFACDYVFDADKTGITSAIFHFDRDTKERDFGDESRLICVHTWFARVFLKTPDTGNDVLRQWHIDRIEKVVAWVRKANGPRGQVSVMDEDVQIAWTKYFDRVFCIMLLDDKKERLPRLEDELARVDLLGSPIFEWRYDVSIPLDKAITEYSEFEHIVKDGYKKNIYNYARIMQESLLLGYKRILIIEDDVAFLKDKREIIRYLESLPSYPIVQMSKFSLNDTQIEEIERAKIEGKRYFQSQVGFTDASCNIFSREGMQICLDVLSNRKIPTDWIGHIVPDKVALATKNLSVQVLYNGTLGFDANAIGFFHDCYSKQGIDEQYSDYAVPEGYDMSKVYEERILSHDHNGDSSVFTGMRTWGLQKQGLMDMLNEIPGTNLQVLEVGSFAGESAEIFLDSGKVRHIVCIDPWEDMVNDNPRNCYNEMAHIEWSFDRRMERFRNRVTKFKGTFDAFVKSENFKGQTFDLVYIDALHDYEHCKHDIETAKEVVIPRIGIAGHDYSLTDPMLSGVKQAVDEIFGAKFKTFSDTSWLYLKSQDSDRKVVKKGRKFVSVYAIARNEASVAERWYECAKEADEVCVLVNNSTDDTADILRRLGANVTVKNYDDWSFAVARNDSMSLVSPESEILFTFDLDETIAPGWRKKLEDAWIAEEEKGNKPVTCLYKYIWSFLPNGKEAQSFSVSKIHANGHGKWKYRCHELLTELNGYGFFLNDFVVEHHQNTGTNRSKYLGLLQKDAADLPQDDRAAFYYARELMYEGQWVKSIEEHKRHLSLPSARWKAERAASMRNIATCYENLKSPVKQELWLWKAASEDPTHREAFFRLGQMFLENKEYPSALDALARCLAIEEPSLEYISPPIVWSGYPYFLFSQALWWNGDWDGAVKAVEKALEIEPHNAEYRSQLEGMKDTKAKFKR